MRLTTKGRFAVTAMIDLALRCADGPVTLAGIADRQKISLSADCDVLRFKIILNIDSHLTSRKITDMSLTCRDIILLSKKLLDGLHLRW